MTADWVTLARGLLWYEGVLTFRELEETLSPLITLPSRAEVRAGLKAAAGIRLSGERTVALEGVDVGLIKAEKRKRDLPPLALDRSALERAAAGVATPTDPDLDAELARRGRPDLTSAQVAERMRLAWMPGDAIAEVIDPRLRIEGLEDAGTVVERLQDLWNRTPRFELRGRSPIELMPAPDDVEEEDHLDLLIGAETEHERGNCSAAIQIWERLLDEAWFGDEDLSHPHLDYFAIAHELVDHLRGDGRTKDALEWQERVLAVRKAWWDEVAGDEIYRYASLLMGSGRLDEGMSIFDETLDAHPEHAFGRAVYGEALIDAGLASEAVSRLERALALAAAQDPDDEATLNDIRELLAEARGAAGVPKARGHLRSVKKPPRGGKR